MNQLERIAVCEKVRANAAAAVAELLNAHREYDEVEFRDVLAQKLKKDSSLHAGGWYAPPPLGIAALFSAPGSLGARKDATARLNGASVGSRTRSSSNLA